MQVFIYLNRRASLVDTTTCRPAYHIAEPGEGKQPFPVRSYDLLGGNGGNSTGSRDLGKVGYSSRTLIPYTYDSRYKIGVGGKFRQS